MMLQIIALVLLGLGLGLSLATTNPSQPKSESDRVLSLPGWSPRPLPSAHYSGFVDANDEGTYQMHYWLVESENDPKTDPLILWFNGGPGASSLYGLLVELGPFILSDISLHGEAYDATGIPQLQYNPYGWQKTANVLALSMPPPVGFSYCTPPGPSASGNDCGSWNDTSTAVATYTAIKSWLKRFPQYKKNPMFVTGESYAGVYVPMIVRQILADPDAGINLQGFAVGDACTPPDICGSKPSGPYWSIQFLFGKGAFSNKLYEEIFATCSDQELKQGGLSDACATVVDKVNAEAGGYWVYGFYDTCWYENDIRRQRKLVSYTRAADHSLVDPLSSRQAYYGPPIIPGAFSATAAVESESAKLEVSVSATQVDSDGGTNTIPDRYSSLIGGNGYACGGPAAQVQWLNIPSVRQALHIPADAIFFQCDNGGDFTYTGTETDLVSWYKQVIQENKLRILVYNGDTDPCINSYQAQNWTRNLGFSEVQSWRPFTLDGCSNVGGYVTRYENNFDFLTIRGSGHMVPLDRPQASLEFISRFVKGEDYKRYDPSCTSTSTRTNKVSMGV